MSITKANLLSFANAALDGSYTGSDLDEAIALVLEDLSKMHCLQAEDTSQALASDERYLSYPTLALDTEQAIISVVLTNSSSVRYDSLHHLPGGWDSYNELMQAHDIANVGRPKWYAIHDRKIYLWPPPDGAYTSSIWSYVLHGDVDSGIDFNDAWATAIKYGVLYYWAVLKASAEYLALWEPRYLAEKERMRTSIPRETLMEGA